MKLLGDKKIILPITFLLLLTLCITAFTMAGTDLVNTSEPAITMHSLDDIYALIDGTPTSTPTLYPNVGPDSPSMHSISELYIKLANLIHAEDLASSSVTYLGVTGGTSTPANLDPITKEFDPTSTPGTITGFTLDDIYNLVTNTTDGTSRLATTSHESFEPTSSPTVGTMHTLDEIYNKLSTLIDPANIATGTVYLGVPGTYQAEEPEFCGGDGQENTPYQICSWMQLNNVRDHLDSDYILMNDLSASDEGYTNLGDNWQPIGTCNVHSCPPSGVNPFSGNFDGNDKTISDLSLNLPGVSGVGFFGYITGNISNLSLNVENYTAQYYLGGLVGWNQGGTITGCHVNVHGLISARYGGVSGLVGDNYGNISNSSVVIESSGKILQAYGAGGGLTGSNNGSSAIITDSSVEISGEVSVVEGGGGGLVGGNNAGVIDNCSVDISTSGRITGPRASSIGGLVAENTGQISNSSVTVSGAISGRGYVAGLASHNAGSIINSFVTGNFSGSGNYTAGLVGYFDSGEISDSYSTVSFTGSGSYTGGLIARKSGGTVSNSFWDIEASGQAVSAGGTGTTTLAMQTPATFTNVGWLESIWNLAEGNYPTLK